MWTVLWELDKATSTCSSWWPGELGGEYQRCSGGLRCDVIFPVFGEVNIEIFLPTKLIGHKLFDSMNMKTVSHESRTECFCKLSIDFSFTVIQDSHIYVSQRRSNTEKYFEFNPTVQSWGRVYWISIACIKIKIKTCSMHEWCMYTYWWLCLLSQKKEIILAKHCLRFKSMDRQYTLWYVSSTYRLQQLLT